MTKKKWTRRKTRILIIVICIILAIIGLVMYFTGNKFRLKMKGYNKFEVDLIVTNTDFKDIKNILKYDYMNQLSAIIDVDTYDKKNMHEYVKYYQKNKKKTAFDIVSIVNAKAQKYDYSKTLVSIVNDKSFKQENLDKYYKYYQENEKALAKDIVYLVNNDIEIAYSTILSNIINEEYYLTSRFKRYIDYANKNPNVNAKEIVARVNADRDIADYEKPITADSSKNELVLVNKHYKLDSYTVSKNYTDFVSVDSNYASGTLLKVEKNTYLSFVEMADKAKQTGLKLLIKGAYISSSSQKSMYDSALASYGYDYANRFVPQPLHSEFQSGYAIDITNNGDNFKNSNEYKWLLEHAHEYGFILRYPEGKQAITGFEYSPTHFRYVGREVARIIYQKNITFDEYYTLYILKK